jgi:hypothetical protein
MTHSMTLICLGPELTILKKLASILSETWQLMSLQTSTQLRPWQTRKMTDSVSVLEWGTMADSIENHQFLLHLLHHCDAQAIWVTQPEWAFVAVFAARLLKIPAYIELPDHALKNFFSGAEYQWLLENAVWLPTHLKKDSKLLTPFPIAPHLAIVYTNYVSDREILN